MATIQFTLVNIRITNEFLYFLVKLEICLRKEHINLFITTYFDNRASRVCRVLSTIYLSLRFLKRQPYDGIIIVIHII